MITAAICLVVGFAIGAVVMGLFAGRDNRDCETCDALKAAQDECRELEKRLHGMRSSNGKLGKELQSMAFRNAGFRER
jgi:uncharacterized membrane-anchored protein YhcB (DUF1043 family)